MSDSKQINNKSEAPKALDLRSDNMGKENKTALSEREKQPIFEKPAAQSEIILPIEQKSPENSDAQNNIVVAGQYQKKMLQRGKEIEKVLSEGMEKLYISLDKQTQVRFKQAGEETGRKINELLNKGKIAAKSIIDLIKKWLIIIPGINKFFLEQEAKIKTDKILRLGANNSVNLEALK